MVWCSSCAKNVRPDNADGKICCSFCGRVLDEDNFSQEPTFAKNASGQNQMSGKNVQSIQSELSISRERTVNEAYCGILNIMTALGIDGGHSIATAAKRIYEIALDRNFTRGRRREQVQAACLYITCRAEKKPYLLIDFSEHLRINVYVLGAVFLQLCKILSLHEHEDFQNPVDPSLFIHRFTDRLFGGRKPGVSRTALRYVASMKRDWMQTGRKPSGICGAALYVSAIEHNLKCSKSDIIKVVHICEATLTKRLIEFENTESGGLTIEEFNTRSVEIEKEEYMMPSHNTGLKGSGNNELRCKHKGRPVFSVGLCESCYKYFIKLSGGLNGESEPPAFQRAEMQRVMAEEDSLTLPPSAENMTKNSNSDKQRSIKNTGKDEVVAESNSTGATLPSKNVYDSSNDRTHEADVTFEESESLSDIDDSDVELYLHNEEEKKLKKIIWEEMNKEYLEEQAAKEAAALAAKKAYEANFANCSDDVQAAQRLAAAAAEAVAKSRKERQQKRAADAKNAAPPQNAAEATKQMLEKKRLSSKIRYDVLEKLFAEPEQENTEITKKTRVEPETDLHAKNKEDTEIEGTEDDTYVEEYDDGYNENMEEFDQNDGYSYFD